MFRFLFPLLFAAMTSTLWHDAAAQNAIFKDRTDDGPDAFNDQDRLRGSLTPERTWWDLKHYQLAVEFFPATQSLTGSNTIRFTTLEPGNPGRTMQIDLQEPLQITKVLHHEQELNFSRNGSVYLIEFAQPLAKGAEEKIEIFYQGVPVESKNPPWSGGLSWQEDDEGNPFITTTCQGIGASIWWPTKDHGYDEPDDGMQINVTVPEDLVAVANGRLAQTDQHKENKTKTFHWIVTQPINNYCVNVNIGNYVHFADRYEGESGTLDMDYWVLEHQRDTAELHFKEAPRTIEAFEYWFGPYPFYQDSYKLVVVPYPGMEHQSSVTYGNNFANGYRGKDLSGTGVGLKFDFIIVHESGHEWFGNNISMKDIADMWIHESFTNYSENLFVEYHFTEKEAQDYVIGCRKLIKNDRPIIGTYDVNHAGSGDMYYKGGNMLHTLRHMLNDDKKWRSILRGLNKTFWHQTVSTQQVEDYLSAETGMDLGPFFDQYLRTTDVPVVKFSTTGNTLTYQFENVVPGFSYPVVVSIDGENMTLKPTEVAHTLEWKSKINTVELDRNFYMEISDADQQ